MGLFLRSLQFRVLVEVVLMGLLMELIPMLHKQLVLSEPVRLVLIIKEEARHLYLPAVDLKIVLKIIQKAVHAPAAERELTLVINKGKILQDSLGQVVHGDQDLLVARALVQQLLRLQLLVVMDYQMAQQVGAAVIQRSV